MNHNRFITRVIPLIMVLVMLAGCGSAKVSDPCPTIEPQLCPTAVAQECPECAPASAFVPINKNTWFSRLATETDFTITFDPGEKCSMKGVSSHGKGLINYDLIVNDQSHQTYALVILTLDEGKTLDDLKAYTSTTAAPSWTNPVQYDYETPGSYSHHKINVSEGPLYFVCFYGDKQIPVIIGHFGPLEITGLE